MISKAKENVTPNKIVIIKKKKKRRTEKSVGEDVETLRETRTRALLGVMQNDIASEEDCMVVPQKIK